MSAVEGRGPPLPRRSVRTYRFALFIQTYQSSPIGLSGRPAHCPFRGLLGVHSRYGLHTRAVTVFRGKLTRGFIPFFIFMTAPVASGLERLPGGTYTHWKAPPLHGAHPHRTSISRRKRVTLRSHWVPNYAHRPSPEICSRDEIDEEPNTRRNHRPRAAPPTSMGNEPICGPI